MLPKYQKLLEFIESLPQGESISVRSLAGQKNVSQGTAYRAIKEADKRGLVKTMPRVGTVRVADANIRRIRELTFQEVTHIVEGEVLGGHAGLNKTLNRFLIAAMELSAAAKYIAQGNLVIVGNREDIQEYALQNNAPVLITGGFNAPSEILKIADANELPVISTAYDTFSTASLISRAINERMVEKKILLVEDIMVRSVHTLEVWGRVAHWYQKLRKTHHTRFPVVDEEGIVLGMVTAKDVAEEDENIPLNRLMTRDLLKVFPKTSLAYASHLMVWGGVQLLPVVDENQKLMGIITRQDVINALHSMQKQPQVGEALETRLMSSVELKRKGDIVVLMGKVKGYMLNDVGVMSKGVMSLLISYLASVSMQELYKFRGELENLQLYFLYPLMLGNSFEITAEVTQVSKKEALIELRVVNGQGQPAAKGMAWGKIMGG